MIVLIIFLIFYEFSICSWKSKTLFTAAELSAPSHRRKVKTARGRKRGRGGGSGIVSQSSIAHGSSPSLSVFTSTESAVTSSSVRGGGSAKRGRLTKQRSNDFTSTFNNPSQQHLSVNDNSVADENTTSNRSNKNSDCFASGMCTFLLLLVKHDLRL